MDTGKVPLVELMEAAEKADETMRATEVRRQARRLGELEQRFEHVIATMDVQQAALAKLIEAREIDREQIAKLMMANVDLRYELHAIRTAQKEIREQLAAFSSSLQGVIDA